jgi:hypothetical protein
MIPPHRRIIVFGGRGCKRNHHQKKGGGGDLGIELIGYSEEEEKEFCLLFGRKR